MTDIKQSEALRLADELLFAGRFAHETEETAAKRRIHRNSYASTELRRLHEVNAELVKAVAALRQALAQPEQEPMAEVLK